MSHSMKLYLFGDQTFDIRPHLKGLLARRDNVFLQLFLTNAYKAIRTEIYQLSVDDRADLPRFTCEEDLLAWDQSGPRCVPLDMAMMTLYHLGVFISQPDNSSQSGQELKVVGLCTGAFAAAAVSCSNSLQTLVSLAVQAVVAAFRTGLIVTDAAKKLGEAHSIEQSWAMAVSGTKSAAVVQAYCEQSNLPLTSRPYVSAYAPHGITVSGTPEALLRLTKSPGFKGLANKSLPIHGAYHAPHLYSQADARRIVMDLSLGSLAHLSGDIAPLADTGLKPEERSFTALLEDAISQTLVQPIQWSTILDPIQSCLSAGKAERFEVKPIGSTADSLIYTALKQTPFRSVIPTSFKRADSQALTDTPPPAGKKSKLAIVAMAGRFPSAKDNEAYWDILSRGLDVHKVVPSSRWDGKTHVDPTGTKKNTSATPFGCWLDEPAAFDARFFNISPREASRVDPAQRLALLTAYEAIEQAGIVPDATPSTRPDRVGVFYGVTSNDWMETNSSQDIDPYLIPGGNRAFIPGRINYYFKFSGPSYAVDTACSSSLASIHLACNALWNNEIDTAIAGGTNVLTNPDFTAGLDRGHFLSRTGNCKTFDNDADGYCRGEGIATLILKRLDDAIAEHDPILGVVLGAYTNHSAESESITRPHVGAQRSIFSKVLSETMVDPYSVGYVEMHGTGTQAGDSVEMSSVLETFAPWAEGKPSRTDDQALYLGSAKANIGHGEAASGACSVIKALQMMQKDTIVPHCGIKKEINHKFPTNLQQRNVHIATQPIPWIRPSADKPRRIFVNNFSAAGGNSSVLLEDAPVEPELPARNDTRTQFPVAISAKNAASLQGNLRSLLQHLKNSPQEHIGRLSYTTTARRTHHPHRVLLTGSNINDICTGIETALQKETGSTRPIGTPGIVFTFTGQGAQYPGMGRQLYEENSFVGAELDHLDRISQSLGFPSFMPFIQSDQQDVSLFEPCVVQLASVCLEITLSKLWATLGVKPTAVVGHSLGEYAALNVAGVLSDTDTIFLIGSRAKLLDEKCDAGTHSMLVVMGSPADIQAILKEEEYETACINSPVETVLAGTNERVAHLKTLLSAAGMKSTALKVPYAFHSSQLNPILAEFEELARGVTFSAPRLTVLRPLDGSITTSQDAFTPEYLATHSRQLVNMQSALSNAHDAGVITERSVVLEVGPHPAVTGMLKGLFGQRITCLTSLQRGRPQWDTMTMATKSFYEAGVNINWPHYQRDFKDCHRVISLPAYAWDLKDYWIQYVNDWSLRKGDPPLVISSSPTLESTTIHSVVEENGDSQKTHMIVESDIARKDLSPLVQGHEVDGVPLCTPSVYADMALSLGKYLLTRHQPERKDDMVDVSDMEISKALILRGDGAKQALQAHLDADWSTSSASVKFMSFDKQGQLQTHAQCVVRFHDYALQTTLQDKASSIRQKMQALRDGVGNGKTARFNRPMVYRMIRPLARFHDDYRAIDEVILDSQTLEASSRLSFGSVKRDGDFSTHPAIIDSLTQSCGFAMNCNDGTDLDKEVFMNHGWGSLQLFEPIDFDKTYTTYTQMHPGKDSLWHGDVVIFDEAERVVAFFGQIAIQGVPRRVLKVILSLESGKKSQPAQPQQKAPVASRKAAPAAAEPEPSEPKISKALEIIAAESGLGLADLTDDTAFSDVGVDSLASLAITSRFRDELDVDIEFSSIFFEHPTVRDLKKLLEGFDAAPSSSSSDSDRSTVSEGNTPGTETPVSAITDDDSIAEKLDQALAIIAEESGVSQDSFQDGTNFADCGVDSLLSLVIANRFEDAFGVQFSHEQLFMECETVADLKATLTRGLGGGKRSPSPEPIKPVVVEPTKVPEAAPVQSKTPSEQTRQEAIDSLVKKYTDGFSAPTESSRSTTNGETGKVVLVTGATGGLGGHLALSLSRMQEVSLVVCLNRSHREDPYRRQSKSMEDKGVHFPEELTYKLLVLQADTSAPKLGLSAEDYEYLARKVTHIIHNAWPMSAKRPLAGFESQFQVMRNLLDLSREASSHRPSGFQFGFQLISSIGVVGNYTSSAEQSKTIFVPEQRATIDSLLTNGYAEAKWGCERMLDETLHKYPDRFRGMVVRLGQIAGSKTSGYWNPMEHFGFLIKSSQTLNKLPDVDGTVRWTAVNDIADTVCDLLLDERTPHPFYHIDNPVGQEWRAITATIADSLGITDLVPFREWLELVRKAPQQDNPAAMLADFLEDTYERMACGGLVLDVKNTLEHSPSLRNVGPVSETVVRKYLHIWKEIGFLKTTAADAAGFEAERARLWGTKA